MPGRTVTSVTAKTKQLLWPGISCSDYNDIYRLRSRTIKLPKHMRRVHIKLILRNKRSPRAATRAPSTLADAATEVLWQGISCSDYNDVYRLRSRTIKLPLHMRKRHLKLKLSLPAHTNSTLPIRLRIDSVPRMPPTPPSSPVAPRFQPAVKQESPVPRLDLIPWAPKVKSEL